MNKIWHKFLKYTVGFLRNSFVLLDIMLFVWKFVLNFFICYRIFGLIPWNVRKKIKN